MFAPPGAETRRVRCGAGGEQHNSASGSVRTILCRLEIGRTFLPLNMQPAFSEQIRASQYSKKTEARALFVTPEDAERAAREEKAATLS